MYINCDPASYGRQFVKKIMRDDKDLNDKRNLYYVKDWVELGDLVQMFPGVDYFSGLFYDYKRNEQVSWEDLAKKTFEVKISYLTKKGNYNIRNIRPHQDFDYFLFCFVDCERDFTPKFILVDRSVITDNKYVFTLTPMNGTKNANKDNKDIGYGTTFKKNSMQELVLEDNNLLEGTTYEDVKNFHRKNLKVLEEQYEHSILSINLNNKFDNTK
jgi:hypothetical protein